MPWVGPYFRERKGRTIETEGTLPRTTVLRGGKSLQNMGGVRGRGADRDKATSFGEQLGPGSPERRDEVGPQISRLRRRLVVGKQARAQWNDGVKWTTWPQHLLDLNAFGGHVPCLLFGRGFLPTLCVLT